MHLYPSPGTGEENAPERKGAQSKAARLPRAARSFFLFRATVPHLAELLVARRCCDAGAYDYGLVIMVFIDRRTMMPVPPHTAVMFPPACGPLSRRIFRAGCRLVVRVDPRAHKRPYYIPCHSPSTSVIITESNTDLPGPWTPKVFPPTCWCEPVLPFTHSQTDTFTHFLLHHSG